jgi:hypothetical protein
VYRRVELGMRLEVNLAFRNYYKFIISEIEVNMLVAYMHENSRLSEDTNS